MIKLHHKITAGCLVCFFMLWAVRIPLVVRAASSLPGIYVQESIGTIFSDSALQSNLENVLLSESNIGDSGGTYDIFSLMADCTFTIDTSKIVLGVFNSGGGYGVFSFDVPQDVDFIFYTASSSPRSGSFYVVNDNPSQELADRTVMHGYGRTNSGTENTMGDSMVAFYPWGSGQQGQLASGACLLYSPIPVYSQAEAVFLGAPTSTSGSSNIYLWMLNNHEQLTDVRGSGAVFNGTDIIDPSAPVVEIESIDNHLYTRSFDIGFCQNNLLLQNTVGIDQIGGGYVYIKYDLDEYAQTHINELTLDIDFTISFGNVDHVGHYSGAPDPSGYTFIPFSALVNIDGTHVFNKDWAKNHWLSFFVLNSQLTGSFRKMEVYQFSTAQFDAMKNNVPGGIGVTEDLLDPVSTFAKNLWNRSVFSYIFGRASVDQGTMQLYNFANLALDNIAIDYNGDSVAKFRADACLIADSENQSGGYTKIIDFKTGISRIIDNSISYNQDPFDDISPYDIVPSDGSGSGSGSGSLSGMGNVVQTVSFPSDITVTDGSYQKVAQLYHSDAASVQSGFWAMLGYYADNPMVDTYGEVFGLFPDEFLTYIEACLGICFGFAVFRTLRRR